jgi:hypothetical protein
MKTPTGAQLKAIRANAIELRNQLAKQDRLILQLMAHPDTTREQLWEVHERYVLSVKQNQETQRSLDMVFGNNSWLRIQLR